MKISLLNRGGLGTGFYGQTSLIAPTELSARGNAATLVRPDGDWLGSHLPKGTILATLLAVALGVFVVAQWHSQAAHPSSVPVSRDSSIQKTITRLETEQTQLKKQIAELRAKAEIEQQQVAKSQTAAASLSAALTAQRAMAGTMPLEGSGVEILLDDSTMPRISPNDDPDNYLVHEYQIRDIANVLWGAGAAGIAVNGERFVNSTSVYCVGSTILINDTRTSPPYHIVAIGNPAAIQKALRDSTNLNDLKARVSTYGLVMKVVKVGSFTLPAFDGSIEMKHTGIANGARS
ncbi:MAG TPA: DUF881 domain-containing protein [Chloroflexota bacterium]|nr:DUF881 domain-containing protein [Chloroflexota bacterium]